MATLLLTTAGAVLGGPVGAFVGQTLGSAIDRSILFSGDGPVREGPRLSDLSVQSSALGRTVPLVYGTARLAGNVIWSTGLQERRTEMRQSGGKGARSSTTVEFSYSVSVAIALSARPIASVGRIWADGKLLRDASGRWLSPAQMRVYYGTETQQADPLIQAVEGVTNAPAFRGLAYVVLENLELAEFANRLPNLSFEVIADAGLNLGDLVTELSAAADVSSVQTANLATSVVGLSIARPIEAHSAIESVLAVFPANVSEGDGILSFQGIADGAQLSVVSDQLGAHEENEAQHVPFIESDRDPSGSLIGALSIEYGDPARDFQPGLQSARTHQRSVSNGRYLQSPLILTADQAKRQAEQILALSALRREQYRIRLPAEAAVMEVGDRVSVMVNGVPKSVLIEELDIGGGIVNLTGFPITSLPDLVIDQSVSADFPKPNIEEVGATRLEVLDIPGLGRTASTPRLVAASAGGSSGWRGADIRLSRDNGENYDLVAASRANAVMGDVVLPPGAGPTGRWDDANEMSVRLVRADMSLESRTDLAVLNGANMALVGDEIIQFRNASLEADGTYRLSRLLRGRSGTEYGVAQHQSGERFVLLDGGGLVELDPPTDLIGQSGLMKAVSVNSIEDDAQAIAFSYAGNDLKPLSPVHVRKRVLANGDMEISWVRRSRLGGAWVDGRDVPLSEEQESYELDVLKDGTVRRRFSTTSPSVLYSIDQQMADFGTAPAMIDISLYQMSALVGRGFPWSGTL